MRDGQSLLEQLLAFAHERITVGDVHAMLGSAGEERLARLVGHLVDGESGKALEELETAVREGVDVSQLLEQLFGYFRDCMVALAGCPGETFLCASPGSQEEVTRAAERLGLQTVLAAMQILDHTLGRLRLSTQARMLAELALVRIASLEDLDELAALVARLEGGAAASEAAGAKPPRRRVGPAQPDRPASPETTPSEGEPPAEPSTTTVALTPENAARIWNQALARVSGLGARHAKDYAEIAAAGPNRLVVSFKPAYTLSKSICERPDQVAKFEKALADLTGEPVRVQFALLEEQSEGAPLEVPTRAVSPQQRLLEISRHPMIRRAAELFDAKPIRVDEPPDPE
jgi:DNA polymerase-3 subunit gamma/tau